MHDQRTGLKIEDFPLIRVYSGRDPGNGVRIKNKPANRKMASANSHCAFAVHPASEKTLLVSALLTTSDIYANFANYFHIKNI